MRENRTHGSEGGEDGVLLYPYQAGLDFPIHHWPKLSSPPHRGAPAKPLSLIRGPLNRPRVYQVIQSIKEAIMNKDQAKGAIKNMAGKVQEGAGKLVGSTEQQAKGLKKQVMGTAQEGLGDAKELVKDARDAIKRAVGKK